MKTRKTELLLLCLAVCACGQQKKQSDGMRAVTYGDTVSVPHESPINAKISADTVSLTAYECVFTAPADVRAEAGKMAEVGVPFDGRTTGAYVRLGQKVHAGQPLFGFSSAEFSELAKSYFQARSNKELAERELERKKTLVSGGIVSVRELEEVSNAAEQARRDLEQNENVLKMFGISPEFLDGGKALTINSPISGEVVACEVVPGQYVKNDSAPLAVVADLSSVWVEAQVKETFAGTVGEDDMAEVIVGSDEENPVAGKICYVGQIMDGQTRSFNVVVSCPNPDRKLKPGMYANVRFTAKPRNVVLLPSTAVLQGNDSPYVFVKAGDGLYVRRNVSVETAGDGKVLVKSGVAAGDCVVLRGGIYIAG